jgi:flagellar hook-associated protein 3 FlgL
MTGAIDGRTEKFLADLGRIQRRLERAQTWVTSGRRINQVSDDPDQISRLLAARSELSATTQTHANLNRVKGEVDAAEQALQQAVSLLDRVAVLGVQGATDFVNTDQRNSLADEIGRLLEQMVGLASTATDGRYIFSGDSDGTVPYTVNLAATPPYSLYQGAPATREILHPSGVLIRVARTAQEIFDDTDPSKGVFAAIDGLRLALRGGATQTVKDAVAKVRTASVHLNSELAFYGAAQNQVAQGIEFAFKQELRLRAEIASLEEADLAEAAIELNEARLHQEAALNAQARTQDRPTLFDYLR